MNRITTRIIILAVLGACLIAFFSYKTFSAPGGKFASGWFGGVSLRIEFATTTAARELGLGGRADVPSDYGMLFVFPTDDYYGFWMKDMLVPIDMFWLDAQGHVVSSAADVATSTFPNVLYPTEPARYVLETAAGFGAMHGIATGTSLLLQNFPKVSE